MKADGVKAAGAGSSGGGSQAVCPNADCLELTNVVALQPSGRHRGAPEYSTYYFDQDWGTADPTGMVPYGTIVTVGAKDGPTGDGWLFQEWLAAGSLLDGSLEVNDSFPVTYEDGPTKVRARYMRCALEIPRNSANLTVTASGSNIREETYDVDGNGVLRRFVIGLPGTVVKLQASKPPRRHPSPGQLLFRRT